MTGKAKKGKDCEGGKHVGSFESAKGISLVSDSLKLQRCENMSPKDFSFRKYIFKNGDAT